MITYFTVSDLLIEFKEYFMIFIRHMSLQDIDEYKVKKILNQRYYSEFKSNLETLIYNEPIIKRIYSIQLENEVSRVYKSIPNQLDHDVALCICKDFELIAKYLISRTDNRHIAGMLLSYSDGKIPMFIKPADKNLENAYIEFKIKINIKQN